MFVCLFNSEIVILIFLMVVCLNGRWYWMCTIESFFFIYPTIFLRFSDVQACEWLCNILCYKRQQQNYWIQRIKCLILFSMNLFFFLSISLLRCTFVAQVCFHISSLWNTENLENKFFVYTSGNLTLYAYVK